MLIGELLRASLYCGGLFIRDVQVNCLGDHRARIRRTGQALGSELRPVSDVYTGVGDALGAHFITRRLDERRVKAKLVNSNFLGVSDVEGRNLVIVSSVRFQALLQNLNPPARIRFVPEGSGGGEATQSEPRAEQREALRERAVPSRPKPGNPPPVRRSRRAQWAAG
jgi:hypothetical protein